MPTILAVIVGWRSRFRNYLKVCVDEILILLAVNGTQPNTEETEMSVPESRRIEDHCKSAQEILGSDWAKSSLL